MNRRGRLWIPVWLVLAAAALNATSCGQEASAQELVVTYYYMPG